MAGRPQKYDLDDLLDRAVDLIWQQGPLALSLNEIATRLDLSKPALVRWFGGKEEFLATVLRRYHQRLDAPVRTALAEAKTVEETARGYLQAYVTVLSEKPVGPATGCLLAATTEAYAARRESLMLDTAADLNLQTRAALEEALTRTGAKDPQNLAEYLYGQSVALAFLSRGGAKAPTLNDFLERALKGAVGSIADGANPKAPSID